MPGQAPKGWLRTQVNQFSPQELAKKKSANIVRAAFGHWFDLFKFGITFLVVFIFVQFILLGVEVLFSDISGIKVVAPLEALPEEKPAEEVAEADSVVADSNAVEEVFSQTAAVEEEVVVDEGILSEASLRTVFGVATDDYPEYVEPDQLRLVVTINTIIAILASLFVFYFHFFYLLSEDGQTFGLRFGKVELFRKDGRELSSGGGIGGLGLVPALIFSIFYLLFLPVFVILTKLQVEYAFLWSFIEGFRSLDTAIAGTAITMNVVMTFAYWLLAVVILVGAAFVIGLVFHIIWLLAGVIANAVGKDEPKSIMAL